MDLTQLVNQKEIVNAIAMLDAVFMLLLGWIT